MALTMMARRMPAAERSDVLLHANGLFHLGKEIVGIAAANG
jgi:hypothetical protein